MFVGLVLTLMGGGGADSVRTFHHEFLWKPHFFGFSEIYHELGKIKKSVTSNNIFYG